MSILQNYPMVAQTTPITSDGLPSEDGAYDCVPASIASAILWYEGKSQWDNTINPDKLLNMAYPEGYHGGTAAINFVKPCAELGYYLYPINGDTAKLLQLAHLQLANGHPVIFTRNDPYSSNPADSHVCVWYADGSTNGQEYLIAMDPYPLPGTNTGHPVHNFDSAWEPLLRFNQVWVLEKLPIEEETVTIDITTPGVSTYFQEIDASHWRCKQTGKIIQFAMLSAYKSWGNSALCGLTYLGLPKSSELYFMPGKQVCKQYFERGVLCWDASKIIDNPPGAGDVYLLQLYGGAGQDPAVAQLEEQLKAAGNPALATDMQQIKAISGKY